MTAARALSAVGPVGPVGAIVGRRNRVTAAASDLALLGGSLALR
jgi:hypothetical protein